MRHEFALFVEQFSSKVEKQHAGSMLTLDDAQLIHRIAQVLRMQPSEQVVLFDEVGHAVATLKTLEKKRVTFIVQQYAANKQLQPAITVLLPLLKREAFEEALYSVVELGASVVQLITTQKTQREWGGAKEKERVRRIMIAAAEQSKNFSLPPVHDPVPLEQAVVAGADRHLFFDPAGKPLLEVVREMHGKKIESVVCMIGPEGDLTEHEKELLKKNNFQFCALTPTVLRAQQALAVGLGALRLV